ncbi:MAG: hypothetical protein ACT4QG_09885 [Sporichthyaceae bacterium]
MSSRRRTVTLSVTSGLVLTVLAPIGPLSLPNALGLDPVAPDMPRAVAAEPPPPPADTFAAELGFDAPPQIPVTTAVTRLLPDADRGPKCDDSQRPSRGKARYNGRSVSALYDRVFRPGPEIPHLNGWVPQGLAVWRDWDGKGNTLVLLGMYREGAKSYIVGINPATGRHVGTVRVKASHLGALGVSGKWLIAQDTIAPNQPPAVRRYTLKKLRTKMQRSATTSTKPYMAAYGKPQRVNGASYMFVEGDSVWIGRYARSKHPKMYRYTVSADGKIKQVDGPWRVPLRTQGVMVTEDHFVFTSSLGGKRGRMIVVRRDEPKRMKGPVACLWTPSLPQNMAVYQGRMLTAFESGATRFKKKVTRNKISHLHVGRVDTLIQVVDPASLKPFFVPSAPVELPAAPQVESEPMTGGLSPDRMAERIAGENAAASPPPAPEPDPAPDAEQVPAPAEQVPAPAEPLPAPAEPVPAPAEQVPAAPAPPAERDRSLEYREVPSEHQPADPEFGIEAGPGVPVEQAEAEPAPERISDAEVTERAENNPDYEVSKPA